MASLRQNITFYGGLLLLSAGTLYLGFQVDRTSFWQVLAAFVIAFSGYFWLITPPNHKTTRLQDYKTTRLKNLLLLGLLLRLALIFAFPLLSDDIYRFIWDGHLIRAGLNPFAELPAFYLQNCPVPGLTEELFTRLNSPEYYTIYPPVAQGIFTLATIISPDSWFGAAVVMKIFLFAAEIGSLIILWHLLPRWNLPRHHLLFYWLNPLIIIEIMGNLHFEGAMVFFLLLALFCFDKAGMFVGFKGSSSGVLQCSKVQKKQQLFTELTPNRSILYLLLAALAFALSVASKLLPLMFLPFLIVRLWRKGNSRPFWIFSFAFGLFTLLLFLPLLSSGFLSGFGSSLDLYFRKFEFNASLYYLARAYGYYEIGWNQIARFGPLLAKFAAIGILLMALIEAVRNLNWNWKLNKKFKKLNPFKKPVPLWGGGEQKKLNGNKQSTFSNSDSDSNSNSNSNSPPLSGGGENLNQADQTLKGPASPGRFEVLPEDRPITNQKSLAESRPSALPTAWLFAFSFYLLCATTVHPWYLALPILLSCFGQWRFPLVWSFFIVLTYTSYTTDPYQENLWLVGLEYLVVFGYFIYEIFRRNARKRECVNA